MQRVLGQRQARTWYTAQTGGDAGRTFRREWVPVVKRSALARHLRTSLRAGAEAFELEATGSTLTCFPPIETAMHGTDADLVVIDEAWAFDDDQGQVVEQAVFPTQLRRPNPQTWIVSAGGTIASTWLDAWLTRGEQAIAAGAGDVAVFDWGAGVDDDPADPATWWRSHPGLGDGITEEAIADELARSSTIAAFQRSILNVWPRPRELRTGVIATDRWDALADLEVAPVAHVVAFDVAVDRSHACLVQAGVAGDGRAVVEVLDYRPGTGWVVPAVRAWRAGHGGGIVVADALAAAGMADQLTRAGLDPVLTGPHQMAKACAELVDAVNGAQLAHRAQALLDDAAASAGRRALGDGWAWSRKGSDRDISPLVAATLAVWAARTRPVAPAPFIVTR
jgi:hypothetical protein